jgi:ParB-like chromosome segregation protein Spo0J
MQYEQIAINELKPYKNNARVHSKAQVKLVADSIKEFGFLNPVLIDKNNGVIAGHGRLEAAKLLKLDTVPVLRVEHLTEAQKRAYIIADNRLAELSEWDKEILTLELEELKGLDVDLKLTGFDSQSSIESDDFEFNPKDKSDKDDTKLSIKVVCESQEQQNELFQELNQRGFKVTVAS